MIPSGDSGIELYVRNKRPSGARTFPARTWATDPEASKHKPPMLRAPNGAIADALNYSAASKRHLTLFDHRLPQPFGVRA